MTNLHAMVGDAARLTINLAIVTKSPRIVTFFDGGMEYSFTQ